MYLISKIKFKPKLNFPLLLWGIIFCSLTLLLSGCVNCPYPKKPITNDVLIQKYPVAHFNTIFLCGPANVAINDGATFLVATTGEAQALAQTQIFQQGHILYINVPNALAYRVSINITVPYLKKLTIENGAFLWAKRLSIANLELINSGYRDLNLRGEFVTENIMVDQESRAKIAVSWLASNNIYVQANNRGPVWLAGRTTNLNLILRSDAYFDGKFLHTKNATVYAADSARADVRVIGFLNATTYQKSNVFFYAHPKKIKARTKDASNVLDMER